jgi:3-hydroxyisobutyrate dehydrogenase-like beta-hydroxyacid dehydrogenase
MSTTIGLLHPGEMGSALGAAAVRRGARVLWASAGRGPATRARADADGFEDAGSVKRLVAESPMIVSVCPPAAALNVAREVAALGFRGLYVDANAVAPTTTRTVGDILTRGGATFVDGSIIGPPPRTGATARLFLSGPDAPSVGAVFDGGPLEPIVLNATIGAASAMKMAYSGWNKASQALLMAVRALAVRENIDAALLVEWSRSMPDMPARSERAVVDNTRKAWRFVGEMEEIAATFGAAGLPVGFHEAAAEVYGRLAGWKDTPTAPPVHEVAQALVIARG